MRKLYAVILIMCLLLITGCGGSADQTSPAGGSSSAEAGSAVSADHSEDGAQAEEQSGRKQETDADAVPEQKADAGAVSGIAADSAAESGKSGPAEMYAAYLKTLQAEKDMILAYDWQMRSVKDYGQESNWIRQPIAVTDITGDELPELIYVAGQQNPGTGTNDIFITRLMIDTWRNGRLENLYSDNWDIQAGGGFYYCLFRENTGKALYAYASFGDENWTDEISIFKEENGKLTRSSHLCLKQGPEPDDYNRTYHDYYLDGSSVSESEYQKELDALHAGLTEIVMFSAVSDDVMRAVFDRDGALSMSYADAEQYLLSQGAAEAGGKAGSTGDSAGGTASQDPSSVFADLPSEFWFSSGAGGWSTDMKMNSDGTFYGSFHDSNMGDIGADYPNGTVEVCNFTGRFTDVQKTGDYEYSMRLADLTYENPVDTSSIEGGVRYHYTDAYGLEGGGTFLLYLPGAPTAGMPQEFLDWIAMPRAWSSIPSELPCYGLYNVNTQCGFSGEKDTSSGASSDSSPAETASVSDGQILPESSTRLLTDADLAGLSSDQIQLAINEIYARHGYNFKKDEIRRWFFQYDWYSPVTDNMDQIKASFSDVEKKNVDFLQGHK